jgi:hypothetical protein
MKHTPGKAVTIDKEHDDHHGTNGVVQDSFVHEQSQRRIYRVLVRRNGVFPLRHFNEEYLK